ncbi:MAG: hypothetical protein ACI4BA_06655 [Prevotella sp.]
MESVLEHNFFSLLRSGVLGRRSAINPMSGWKWQRLCHVAQCHDISTWILKGYHTMGDDYFLQQHQSLFISLGETRNNTLDNGDLQKDAQVVDYSEWIHRMTTPFLNKRYESIVGRAKAQADDDTISLFKLIVQNVRCLLNTGVNLHLFISVVRFLLQEKKVDADELATYLRETHLTDMAQYLGELIVTVFQIDVDRVVFMKRKGIRHKRMIEEDLHEIFIRKPNHWFFTQGNHVFVKASDTHAMYQQFGKAMRYFFFAPWETATNLTSAITHSIAHIEE